MAMTMADLSVGIDASDAAGGVFEQIGAFLAEHHLSPEPANYTFAYLVLSAPGSALAQQVSSLTEGGFRLSRQDIEAMGGTAVAGAATVAVPQRSAQAASDTADTLIARTQVQVDGFANLMHAMQAETHGFGRDLAARAAEIGAIGAAAGIEEIARLTASMIARVEDAEARLDIATREANDLRAALDEARGSARTDALTDLPNRRAFDEAFAALTPGATQTVAICDIDNFKQINDRFGHGVGDRVLRAIGQTLASECAGHFVARYGGEEFALLLDVDAVAAARAVDQARAAIAAKRFRSRETNELIGDVTISAGVAAVVAGDPRDVVLGRADAAMYRAKEAGRNCVMLAPDVGV